MWELSRLIEEQELGSMEAVNDFAQEVIGSGKPIRTSKRTPLEQAQEVMYRAWGSAGKQRIRLAKQALAISEDCADAYVLLAEDAAASLSEARGLYERGVLAGERALGSEFFLAEAGNFWALVQTRPYLRSREGLAHCLWHLGQKQEAIGHYEDLLRLNPNDNQGVRYILATGLVELGKYAEADALFKRYRGEGSACWLYGKALLAFKKHGRGRTATLALKKAFLFNPLVPAYLLGMLELPDRLPESVVPGTDSEALDYLSYSLEAWATEEALEWLAETLERLMHNGLVEQLKESIEDQGAFDEEEDGSAVAGRREAPTLHLDSVLIR